MKNTSGLTKEEEEISEHINKAWGAFKILEQTHPDDMKDFLRSIHDLQKVLGVRILRRDYPNHWLTHKKVDD